MGNRAGAGVGTCERVTANGSQQGSVSRQQYCRVLSLSAVILHVCALGQSPDYFRALAKLWPSTLYVVVSGQDCPLGSVDTVSFRLG
jgi:hypothetical protein